MISFHKKEPSSSILSTFLLLPRPSRVSKILLEKSPRDFQSPHFCKRNSADSRRSKNMRDAPRLSE